LASKPATSIAPLPSAGRPTASPTSRPASTTRITSVLRRLRLPVMVGPSPAGDPSRQPGRAAPSGAVQPSLTRPAVQRGPAAVSSPGPTPQAPPAPGPGGVGPAGGAGSSGHALFLLGVLFLAAGLALPGLIRRRSASVLGWPAPYFTLPVSPD
jgi:hypothetical protein